MHDAGTNTLEEPMIGLIQRVDSASVTVADAVTASIDRGLLVLVAVQPDDTPQRVRRLGDRLLTYRVFPDAAGRMNKSLKDERLEMLLVPQFTLAADTRKGTRASFTRAAPPDLASEFFAL